VGRGRPRRSRPNPQRSSVAAAARRLAVLLAALMVGTVVVSLGLGAIAGASADRSISLGFYLMGSFLLVGGFFIGNRGPLRSIGDQGLLSFWGRKGIRTASPQERREDAGASAVYITMGLLLIACGVAIDSRFKLW
jgi:hypothetical protein